MLMLPVHPLHIPPEEGAIVVPPGGSAIFNCPFSGTDSANLTNLIINWQHGDTVVHSFYLGRDQLGRQGQIYKERTYLFMEEVLKGNAALSLNNVQPYHRGEYTCDVNNEMGKTKKRMQLIVAAPYEDPQLAVHYTCNSVVVTLSSSQGFPEPTVSWKHPFGGDVTTTELDTKGFYRVQSNLTLSLNTTQTFVVEMRLEILSQCFIKEITLHPLQGWRANGYIHICKVIEAIQHTKDLIEVLDCSRASLSYMLCFRSNDSRDHRPPAEETGRLQQIQS
ncbi:hypothetical protein AOLI_G00255960 [Acnodon oligacanthus]